MVGVLVETIIVAFIMGGIIGAITALHLTNQHREEPKKVPVKIRDDNHR